MHQLHGQIAAGAKLVAGFGQVVLRAVQRDFDGVLFRMIGAQARPQQTMNTFDIRLHGIRIAADDAPSDTPAGCEIVF